jgi:NAD(P)-dependent dehydrogenase (short-subunit alcohol dehydrogenase family)
MSIIDSLRPAARPARAGHRGRGSGIGAAVPAPSAKPGARVHVCDIDRAALDRLARRGARASPTSMADASVPDDVDLVFDDVQGALWAGSTCWSTTWASPAPPARSRTWSSADWERTVAVNLNSQFYFAQRAVPLLKQSAHEPVPHRHELGRGRLGYAFRTPYASTKWAIVGLMKSLAIELGPQGVRVNAILPGTVEGERMNGVIGARAATARRVVRGRCASSTCEKISLRRMVTWTTWRPWRSSCARPRRAT